MTTPITPEKFEGFWPGRLWSLWDIMDRVQASRLWRSLSKLRREQTTFERSSGADRARVATEKSRNGWKGQFKVLLPELERIGLSGCVTDAEYIVRQIDNPKLTSARFDEMFQHFNTLLENELGKAYLFALSLKEVGYYSRPRDGWEEIIGRFPDTVGDIEEARKCYALSRYAAAVFHSLQIVELGIIDLGRIIKVTDPLEGWSATTNKLTAIIKKKHPERTPFEQQNFLFLEQIHGTIEGLKNAWRNKVSHAHGKLVLMTADFSPEVAEDILHAARAFMRRLATDGPNASAQPPSGQPS